MDELINQLIAKVGLDRAMAEKVVAFLKDHAAELPKWLQSGAAADVLGKVKGGLGGLLGK